MWRGSLDYMGLFSPRHIVRLLAAQPLRPTLKICHWHIFLTLRRGENTSTQPPWAAFTSERFHWWGETAEAPPVAEKARLFRGSGGIGGHDSGRESRCRDGGHLKGGWNPLFTYSIGIRVSWCSRRAATQASTSSLVDSGPKLMRMTPPETFLGSFSVAIT